MPTSEELLLKLHQLQPPTNEEQLLLKELELALADDLWVPNQILLAVGKEAAPTLAAALTALSNEYKPPN